MIQQHRHIFNFHFVLNFFLKCGTIELSDYQAVGLSIRFPLDWSLEVAKTRSPLLPFLPTSESDLSSFFLVYLGLGSLNPFGSTYFSFLSGFFCVNAGSEVWDCISEHNA